MDNEMMEIFFGLLKTEIFMTKKAIMKQFITIFSI